MRPFQSFRLWARRAPIRDRVLAGGAALIAVSLLVWLMVPNGDDPAAQNVFASGSNAESGTGGAPEGAAVPGSPEAGTVDGAAGGAAGAGGAGRRSGAAGGGATVGPAAGGQGCVSPRGSGKGVTSGEVKVAIVLTEIVGPAANTLFDVPTPAEAKADFEAAIAGINKEGGVACRKLVGQYYNTNPVDESGMMALCREIADAGLYGVVDTGSMATRPAVLACFGQRKVPYFGAFYITETARRQAYPYMFSFYTKELVYKATAFTLRDLGFYDQAKGFKKMGFIYRDCEKEAITAFRGWIREAGVPDSVIVPYNVGCPAVFATESDLAQAVLTFKNQGVTHVIPANFQGDIARFTSHAEQQGFRPKYGFPDEALLSIASGSRAPDPNNIANALAVTLGRDAEQATPGMTPTAGTQRCNAYRKTAGLPPVYDVPANAGHACDQLWMLQAALSLAPDLAPTSLVAGLQRVKSIDFSYPQGPNDFTPNGVTTGGQFFRVAQFMPGCKCWQLIQRDFRRG